MSVGLVWSFVPYERFFLFFCLLRFLRRPHENRCGQCRSADPFAAGGRTDLTVLYCRTRTRLVAVVRECLRYLRMFVLQKRLLLLLIHVYYNI